MVCIYFLENVAALAAPGEKMTCTVFHIVGKDNKIYMIDIEHVEALYRDRIVMDDGYTIMIPWDAYPFLDRAFAELEKYGSKIGFQSKSVI